MDKKYKEKNEERQKKADGDLAIEGKRFVLPINGVYNNSHPSLFIISPCPSDDFSVTIMSAFIAGGPYQSAVIFVLVRKYSPHQRENHGGISLRCINIRYSPSPLHSNYFAPERAGDGGKNRNFDW